MRIIPAIDIKDGRCVRLQQGDPLRETVYNESPVSQAQEFERLGATLIHVVDLDGAFKGEPVNFSLVKEIQEAVHSTIEIGGGIRSRDHVKLYADTGINRIILGSAILTDDFPSIAEEFGSSIVAGIDARDGYASTHGWKETSHVKDEDLFTYVLDHGVTEVIYTDIATDGMLEGPSYGHLERLLKTFQDISLVASGGISSIEDIKNLAAMPYGNLIGCITGKAVYDGRVDLAEALKITA